MKNNDLVKTQDLLKTENKRKMFFKTEFGYIELSIRLVNRRIFPLCSDPKIINGISAK